MLSTILLFIYSVPDTVQGARAAQTRLTERRLSLVVGAGRAGGPTPRQRRAPAAGPARLAARALGRRVLQLHEPMEVLSYGPSREHF